MHDEILIEEGIVVSVENGFAEISLLKNENCNDCSAKIICKPQNGSKQLLKVEDPYGTRPGDIVKISIRGSDILKSSLMLYGIPLVILVASVLILSKLLESTRFIEFYSFIAGIIVTFFYYLIFIYLKSFRKKQIVPQIISMTRKLN